MDKYGELRKKLVARQTELMDRISLLQHDKQRQDAPLERDSEEQATQMENDQVIDALDESSRKEFTAIGNALRRMQDGQYEICAVCGTNIPFKRLEALPYTDKCVSCAQEIDG